MSVRSHGNAERPSKAEVSELEVVIFIDQKILWLEVAMEDAVRMAVEEAGRKLVREFLRDSSAFAPKRRCCLPSDARNTQSHCHVTRVILTSFKH